MKFSEQIFGSKEDDIEQGTEQEKLVSRIKKAIEYKILGEDCDALVLEFCSRIGEPFPATKEERRALLEKLNDSAFLERIESLTINDLYTHQESLNDMVAVSYENPEVVLLHIEPVGGEAGLAKLGLFRDGLERLAKLLVTDPRLSAVKTIGALSWIVSEHPRILERFGFSIGPLSNIVDGEVIERKYNAIKKYFPTFVPREYQKAELGFASVSRDDFLRRYGG